MAGELYGGQSSSFVVQSAAVAPITGTMKGKSWLDFEHPRFKQMCMRWMMTQDFYLGEPADEETAKKYLVRRFQGEPDQAYLERVRISDFTPHLGTLLDTLAGQLFGVEDRTTRVWTDEKGNTGLGDPNKDGTSSHRLVHDADGYGTSWKTLWREFTLDLLTYQYMWVLIDTVSDLHVVKLVPPTSVPNWLDDGSCVVMKECVDIRTNIEDEPEKADTFIRWELNGWTRWMRDKEGNAVQMEGGGVYRYQDRNGNLVLPIFCVDLPMRRYVAWQLAKKHQVLFNQESVRDFALRIANFSKLVVSVADKKQVQELKAAIMAGDNVLPLDPQAKSMHTYINPSSEPVTIASEVLNKKIEDYWMSGFKQYADAAAMKTATEVKQDVASGVGAFLQLLAAAIDDAENGALYRLEQAEFGESPTKWGIARTERPDDFSTLDLALVLDGMRKRYLGETGMIPVGRSALIQLAKDAARFDGLPAEQAEIEAAVDAQLLGELIANLQLLNVTPPQIKARLAMRLVAAMGLIDPNEVIEMSDGEKEKLFNVMMTQAEELANVQDKQARMQAEMPAFTG